MALGRRGRKSQHVKAVKSTEKRDIILNGHRRKRAMRKTSIAHKEITEEVGGYEA